MKRFVNLILLFGFIFIGTAHSQTTTEVPFTKGVNLTNWFQVGSPGEIDFSKFTYDDFVDIKSLGVDVIRLPINLHSMTQGGPNHELDPLFLFFLDEVIDWAEELEIYLILDNHTFSPSVNTDPNVGDILNPVWLNMADHFKNRSEFVLYEILNEPHGISNSLWGSIQGEVIETIRTVDSTHTIIVGASDYNSFRSLQFIPEYSDSNLIYTFHFYDPFIVTHQGASWTDPSLVELSGIPFPYDPATIPRLPVEFEGTWIEDQYNNYPNDGTAEAVREALDIAITFSESRGVPVFCGEFGVYIPNSTNDTRINWYEVVASYLSENNVSWTIWDYRGGFGIYEEGSNELFDHDLNIPIVEALGFNVPEQTEFQSVADSTSVSIYDDFIASGLSGASASGPAIIELYNADFTYDGEYSIRWSNAGQYQHLGFDFTPNKDFTRLVDEGFELSFFTRGLDPVAFDIRFIDTKTGEAGDRPWRMNIPISTDDLTWDGNWEEIRIPLSQFAEMGSWDENEWFNPQGDYDWGAVDVFQFVSETGSMTNAEIWFDKIQIVDANAVTVHNEVHTTPAVFKLNQNYPNPFNPNTLISYQLPEYSFVELNVYDISGRKIASLVSENQVAGNHSISFQANGLASGIYFYKLITSSGTEIKKMILLK